jgi:hypothetical protein
MRAALALALACLLALVGLGCDGERAASRAGQAATWVDSDGDGALTRDGRPEPLLSRTELAPAAAPGRELARLVQITDAHIEDEESPAQVKVLDRLGAPFESAFRPQEAMSSQVLAAAVTAVNRAGPQAVVVTGDLVDAAHANELDLALAVLEGGRARPDSGRRGYRGPQEAANPDPLFYRPDVDAPRFPGLLARAQRPFSSSGLEAPWYPVAGNHDLLVEGIAAPTPRIAEAATGDRALVALDPGLAEPDDLGTLDPRTVDSLLEKGLPGRTRQVPPDPARRPLSPDEVLARLRAASGHGGSGPLLDYAFDLGPAVRGVVLDTARREGGSEGVLRPGQREFLSSELDRAERDGRWVLVFSHHALGGVDGGSDALELLDGSSRVLAAVSGHSHRHAIRPRRSAAGGYWLVATAALAEYPQQARAFRVVEVAGGRVALETWTLDHAGAGDSLAGVSRQLAFLDAQGGRPDGAAGSALDRNARLFR